MDMNAYDRRVDAFARAVLALAQLTGNVDQAVDIAWANAQDHMDSHQMNMGEILGRELYETTLW